MYPVRGQTILVHAPHLHDFLCDTESTLESRLFSTHILSSITLVSAHPNGGVTYIIPRSGPDGTVLLGGTYQANDWDTSYDEITAQGIFARCAALEPSLLEKDKVRVLSHNVGLRPAREGGPRVEAEWMKLPLKGALVPRTNDAIVQPRKVMVLHAYGFG
jgi:hypothetical protein